MKKLFLGLTLFLLLISVSCKSNKKPIPISFKYVAGELIVGEYSTDIWKYVALGKQSNGQWSKVENVNAVTPNSVISFVNEISKPSDLTDFALIGSKKSEEEFNALAPEEIKPISDVIKDVKKTNGPMLTKSGWPSISEIYITTTNNADGKEVQLGVNSSGSINIKDYIILIDGEEVTFTQDKTDGTKWLGVAKTKVFGKKAYLYSRKTDAKYLRTNEVVLPKEY